MAAKMAYRIARHDVLRRPVPGPGDARIAKLANSSHAMTLRTMCALLAIGLLSASALFASLLLTAALAQTPASHVIKTGTGFFVSETGHVVTNEHVVQGCDAVRATPGGALQKVAADRASDLALYAAAAKPDAFARLRGGRGARAGETVIAVGFPLPSILGSDPIVTAGIISSLSGVRSDRRRIQITTPLQPGNSGGPLLGEDGAVVGVIVSQLDALKVVRDYGEIPQNVNFAISLDTLKSFLNGNGVSYLLDDSQKTKSPPDITAEATRYAVLIECLSSRTDREATVVPEPIEPRTSDKPSDKPSDKATDRIPEPLPRPAAPGPLPSPANQARIVFPKAVSPFHSAEMPEMARMLTCRDQYVVNKYNGGNGGLLWMQDGGGYFDACNNRLKDAGF